MESQNYLRGIQLFELNRYQDAIGYFKEALQEMPEDFDTIYYISYSYLQLDQIDKAEEIANSLLKIDADNENTYFLLAQISYYLKDLKKAMHHINKAISIYPYEADFFGQKSYIELYTKNYEASLKTANEGLSLDPNNKLCLNARVQALTKLNKKDEAFNSIENLLEKDPENVYSHANVGWSKLENGKTKEALTHFKEALSIDPNYEYAREGMSTALKANNFIYSVYLKYAFWIAKKSSNQQWIFFIGLYFTYKIITKALANTDYSFLVFPIVILYLFFALGTWIMEPLSNAILIFDNYGKYLLDEQEKKSGQAFIMLFGASILAVISYAFLQNNYFLLMAFAFICAILPIPRGFLSETKKNSIFNFSIGILMLLVGIFGFMLTTNFLSLGILIFILLIANTWLDNLIK